MKNLADIRPSDYEYALLSQHVYEGETLRPGRSTVPADSAWRVLEVYPGDGGYFGVLYVNDVKRQLVLAHRGTDSIKALIEDLVGVYKGQWNSLQKLAAYEMTRKSIEYRNTHYSDYHLSFTGHSLGGYLAELGVFFCHRSLDYPDTNAVSFESPGIGTIAERLQSQHNPIQLQKLDIVGYVTYPDLVNTCDRHIGTLYQISTELKSRAEYPLFYTLEAHSKNNIVLLLQNPASVQKLVMDWPMGMQYELFFNHASFKDGHYVLNPDSEDFKQASLNEYIRIYATHYKTAKRVGHHFLSLRHFSPELRNVLKALQAVKLNTSKDRLTARWTKIGIDTTLQKQLLQYELEGTSYGDTLIVLPEGYSANQFRENLAIASKKATEGYCALLPQNEKNEPDEVTGYVNAVITAIAKGVEIEESAEVSPKARLLHVSVPQGMTETEMQPISNLMKESMAALRETVRDLKITAIDENVKIHAGAKVTAEATAVSIEVRDGKEQKPGLSIPISAPSEFATLRPKKVSSSNATINNDSKKLLAGIGSNSTVTAGGDVNVSVVGQQNNVIVKNPPKKIASTIKNTTANLVPRTQIISGLNSKFAAWPNGGAVALTGPRGAGKTQMTRYWCHEQLKKVKDGLVLELDASSSDILLSQYKALGAVLGIQWEDKNTPEDIRTQVKNALLGLEHDSIVILFDNAPNYDTVQPYLLPPSPKKPVYSLITSYNAANFTNASEVKTVPVKPGFTPVEAIQYIQNAWREKSLAINEEEAKQLAELLHYHPLALTQAVNYILQDSTIAEFCGKYKQYKSTVFGKGSTGDYKGSVLTITRFAVEKLSEPAKNVLYFCSFLHPTNIPKALLEKFIEEENRGQLSTILEELHAFSLLTRCDDASGKTTVLYELHGLTQEVVREHILNKQMQEDVILKATKAIEEEYPEKNPEKIPSMEDRRKRSKFIPHMQSILQHSKKIFTDSDKVKRVTVQLPLLLSVANAYGNLGDADTKKNLLERVLPLLEAHFGKEHPKVAITLTSLANAHNALDAAKAKELLERALPILEAHLGKEHPKVATTLVDLAIAHGYLRDALTQKNLLERALPILEAHYGKEHPKVATTLVDLAIAHGNLGDALTQKNLLERALLILETHYVKEHPKVVTTLVDLAIAHGALGDASPQKALLERALPILEAHYGKEYWYVAIALTNLANAHGALGDALTQKNLLERALAIQEADLGKEDPWVGITLLNLGIAKKTLGETKSACEDFNKAYSIFLQHFGENCPHTKKAKDNLENCRPGWVDWLFGRTTAEENVQAELPTMLFNTNDMKLLSKDEQPSELNSTLGVLSLIGTGSLLYSRYHYNKKATENTWDSDKFFAPMSRSHLVTPIPFPASTMHNTMNTNSHDYSVLQPPPSFFSRKALPPIVPVKLPNLGGAGRVGLLGATMGVAFYGGWQMMQQHKQSKLLSENELVILGPVDISHRQP